MWGDIYIYIYTENRILNLVKSKLPNFYCYYFLPFEFAPVKGIPFVVK